MFSIINIINITNRLYSKVPNNNPVFFYRLLLRNVLIPNIIKQKPEDNFFIKNSDKSHYFYWFNGEIDFYTFGKTDNCWKSVGETFKHMIRNGEVSYGDEHYLFEVIDFLKQYHSVNEVNIIK